MTIERKAKAKISIILAAVILTVGCSVQPTVSQVLRYRCEDGREFSVSLTQARDTANIEIARMRFVLFADQMASAGEQFSCGILTLRREGDLANVEMEGEPHFRNCRLQN